MKREFRKVAIVISTVIMVLGTKEYSIKSEAMKTSSMEQNVGVNHYSKIPTNKKSKKESYIVVTKSKEKVEKLCDEYANSSASECSSFAENKNMVSIKMTGEKASEIQNQTDIYCVERDVQVMGCANTFDYRKISKKKIVKGKYDWNKKVIKVNKKDVISNRKVKVAVLDSGICFGNDIEVEEQINLIPGEEELSVLFEDGSGHGTSVAGIIAAEDNDEGITGINPNIELYSAKILSDKNSAPISRVVEGIYWAISKNVNIINISFSTPYHSQVLKQAIEDAYSKGILIIAAAGNGETVEYPAAYPEVMAVGSVDSKGEKSGASASGQELEIVAPGEKVVSTALLGGTMALSGTSLAAPHVVGVASLLWQKDLSVSADFIRELLNYSANGYGDEEDYGNGLVDYTYAKNIYNKFKEIYNRKNGLENIVTDIEKNETKRIVYEENNAVEGRWTGHDKMAASYTKIQCFQKGAKAPDVLNGLKGLNAHHPWHGGKYSNYVATYRYLNKVARAVNNLGTNASLAQIKSAIRGVGEVAGMYNYTSDKVAGYRNGIYTKMKEELCQYVAPELKGLSKGNKGAYVFGLASHVATDAYSHSTYLFDGSKWDYIQHHFKNQDLSQGIDDRYAYIHADNAKCVARRYRTAKAVLNNVVARYNGKRSNIDIIRDFLVESVTIPDTKKAYYNTSKIAYTKKNQDNNATYRLHKFYDYMGTAGEKNKSVLSLYLKMTVM